MRKTFVGLDAMRFALAVYLMIFHTVHAYPQAINLPFIELADLGGFATSSFFILSGFILTHLYVDRSLELQGGARNFIVKRLSNLYPVHFIGLLPFALASLVGIHSADSFLLRSLTGPQQVVQLSAAHATFNWLLNVSMLQVWDARFSSINAPSWSLSCLLFFYLAFPIFGPRLANTRCRVMALVALWVLYLVPPVTVVLIGAYGPSAVGTVEHNPILRIPEFLSGVLLYSLYGSGHLKWMTCARWRKAAAAVFVLTTFVLASHLAATGPMYFLYILHNGAMLPSELAFVILCADAAVPRWAERITSRLGNAALSIFAIHVAMFIVMMKALKLTALNEPIFRCVTHFSICAASAKTVDPAMTTYPLYLIATVVASVFFQERCVVPIRTAIRRALLRPAGGGATFQQPP